MEISLGCVTSVTTLTRVKIMDINTYFLATSLIPLAFAAIFKA
jgi:hypothetical protein